MKKLFMLILSTFLVLNTYSQTSFEKAYYIDNSNQIVDCLIKNKDWESNPDKFNYKLSESSEPQTLTIESVKEFGIHNTSKFIRCTVNIDRSSEITSELSKDIAPLFTEEVVFLRVLIEGKANLYSFNEEGLLRFFFSTGNAPVEPLVYKSYLTSNNRVAKNNQFRQQLMDKLKCTDISVEHFQNIAYTQKDLVNLFKRYNECNNSASTIFEEKQNRDLFNLTLKPGYTISSLYIQNDLIYYNNVDFGDKQGFRLGLEAEFILPFNNNKWSVPIEAGIHRFKSSVTKISNQTTGEEIYATADYKYLELSGKLRYYFFLNERSKVYVNASLAYDFPYDSKIDIFRDDDLLLKSLDIKGRVCLSDFGLGYKYNDRYTVEINYQYGKNLLGNYKSWTSTYSILTVAFGYSVF